MLQPTGYARFYQRGLLFHLHHAVPFVLSASLAAGASSPALPRRDPLPLHLPRRFRHPYVGRTGISRVWPSHETETERWSTPLETSSAGPQQGRGSPARPHFADCKKRGRHASLLDAWGTHWTRGFRKTVFFTRLKPAAADVPRKSPREV
jgi:hypothetical protein